MIVIGLTGSIGMGKSTTALLFRDEGVPVHDSDAAVHELYGGSAVTPVEARFPGVTINGRIDRDRLAARVIGDADALKQLERIVHPLVSAHRAAFLETARASGAPLAVVDIPLLFETGADRTVDVVVVVSAPALVQKQRVLARSGMTESKFEAILNRQTPDAEKRRRAHVVIDSSLGLASARREVQALVRSLTRA